MQAGAVLNLARIDYRSNQSNNNAHLSFQKELALGRPIVLESVIGYTRLAPSAATKPNVLMIASPQAPWGRCSVLGVEPCPN